MDHELVRALLDPESAGLLVRAAADETGATRSAYSRLSGDQMSWCRGFLGLPPLVLDWDAPVDRFCRAFGTALAGWLERVPSSGEGREPSGQGEGHRWARMVEHESRFVAVCLEAIGRWTRQGEVVVLWDIDETLIGSGSGVRFLRPSSEAVLRYVARHFPRLRNGILSSLAPRWIPAASELIGEVLGRGGSFAAPPDRFSFRPALDRWDTIPWETVREALRCCGLPDCGPGGFERGWPFYPAEFARVLSWRQLAGRAGEVRFIDNDLNACFDVSNTAENQVSSEARQWLKGMVGDACAAGPHWWPQDAEEWILERIDAR